MKTFFLLTGSIIVLISCNNSSTSEATKNEKPPDSLQAKKESFFPVTSYIRGELFEFKNDGINPIKHTTINNHTDSVWLKVEEVEGVVKEFLYPEIDSLNLVSLFSEKSFLDQSIDSYTFTYDPDRTLPDTMTLKHWDVYIDPSSGKVKRIYMVKEISKNKTLQLTWQSRKWCKITSIITDQNGKSSVEKEEKITWDF